MIKVFTFKLCESVHYKTVLGAHAGGPAGRAPEKHAAAAVDREAGEEGVIMR